VTIFEHMQNFQTGDASARNRFQGACMKRFQLMKTIQKVFIYIA